MYAPEDVGDLEARGREVEQLQRVTTVPCLSQGVASTGLGQLVASEEDISRLYLGVRHTYRLVILVQLEGVRCTDTIRAVLGWRKAIT